MDEKHVLIRKCQRTLIFNCVTLITFENVLCLSVHTILFISKRICCLSDNFIVFPYAFSRLHGLLQELLSCLQFLRVVCVVRVASQEAVKEL